MSAYNVEILDEYLYLQEVANDHQIRVVIEFNERIDSGRLQYAIRESFKYVPVLASRLIVNGTDLLWEGSDSCDFEKNYFNIIEGDFSFSLLKETLEKHVDQYTAPQLNVTVLRSQKNDVLVITVNHMVFDGTGFKNYLTLLSGIYNGVTINKKEVSAERDIFTILKPAGKKRRNSETVNRFLTPGKKSENRPSKYGSVFFTTKTDKTGYSEIQRYCRSKGVTVNDYMMTAFVLALIDSGLFKLNKVSDISMMIDARRYDHNRFLYPYINASSMEKVSIFCNNRNKEELLLSIHSELKKIKLNMPGYRNLLSLRFFRSLLPRRLFFRLIKKKIMKPVISATNIGVLDKKDFQFDGSKITNAFFVASLKRNSSIQFTFSTFDDAVTITTFGSYSEDNIERINLVYHYIEKHLNFYRQYI